MAIKKSSFYFDDKKIVNTFDEKLIVKSIMRVRNEDLLFRNNTGNKSKEILIEGFVIRTKEFEEVLRDVKVLIKGGRKGFPNLIIGQRGAGKTTLLHRIKYAIEDDPKLNGRLLPIMLSEEQYNLSELVNLWETIASALEDNFAWTGLYKEIEKILTSTKNYEQLAFELLETRLRSTGNIVVLFIENISVFLRKLDEKSRERFRHVFTMYPNLHLIASSTSFLDSYINYGIAPFDYFKITLLEGLNREECEKLLIRIGAQFGVEEDIRYVIQHHPGRVESLRRLTGGVPRTISYLFQIFLDNENGKAIKDLYILIDTLTFLYKAELDQLSPQQQKVIDVIARKWEAIPVKEIAKLTRFESKNVSSILSALEKNQMIEIVRTSSKNHLYRIRERFMNIWYLMRFGRKHDKDNIIWLVRFFDAWCDETELAKRVAAHIDNLKGGEFDVNAAIDMGNTFLSCENVPQELKLLLYTETKSMLPERLAKMVSIPGDILYNRIQDLVEEKKFEDAVNILEQIGTKDIQYYSIATWLFLVTGDYKKSVDAATTVLELDENDAKATLTLGLIYEDYLNDIDKAEYYLKACLEQKPPHPYAASRLGDIAFKYRQDLVSAEKYHRQAIKRGFKPSMVLLGDIFFQVDEFEKAEELYLSAAKAKVEGVNNKLGILYSEMNDNKGAKKFFEKALEANEKEAIVNIGIWYRNKKRRDLKKAQFYFEKAISEGIIRGYSLLGELYQDELNDVEQAIGVFEKGIENKDSESAHLLAHIYSDRKDYSKSDEMFLKSLEWGRKSAVFCLINDIYSNGRKDKKGYALQLFKDYLPNVIDLEGSARILYARILLWNDLEEESLNVLRGSYQMISNLVKGDGEGQNDSYVNSIIAQTSNYLLLLIAKGKYNLCLSLFEETEVDFKTMLKPIYFALMEYLKNEFPFEYLKAGDEFKDTIVEIKKMIEAIKKKV